MLRQIWAMTWKEIKVAAQRPSEWLLVFLAPIIFIAVMGAVFGGGGAPTVAVYLVDEDGTRLSRQVVDALEDEPTLEVEIVPSREEADRRVGAGDRIAAVVVPAGFDQAILTDEGGRIEVIVDPAREQSAGVVLGQVQAATAAMLIDAEVTRGVKQAFNTAPELMGVDDIDFDELGIDLEAVEKFLTAAIKGVVSSQVQDAMDDPLVRVAPQPASDVAPLRAPTVFDYVVPGYSVFFALFLMGLMAETVLQERLSGTLRRLFSLPLSRTAFLIGKILPYSLIAMVQIVLVLGMSSILFDYDLGQAPLALMLMIVATGLAVGSVGMMVAVLVRSEGQANSVPNLLTLVLAAVSGSMFPSIRLPGIENLTPNYWAIQGFLRISALQGTFDTVVLNIVVLLGMSVVAFAVAAWRFRYE